MRDLDVRRALHELLREQHRGQNDTLVLDELGVANGRRRVDVAVVNGELTGYEIKSAADTLQRLPGQASLYNQVFDRMWLVVADRHHAHALTVVPEWWGVVVAATTDGKVHVDRAREAGPNLDEQKGLAVAQLLWREEALALLDRFGIGDSRLRRGSRRHMYTALAEHVDLPQLKPAVRTILKARQGWR